MSPLGVFVTGVLVLSGIVLQVVQIRKSTRLLPVAVATYGFDFEQFGAWWPPSRWPRRVAFRLSTKRVELHPARDLKTFLILYIKERTFPAFALGCIMFFGTIMYSALEVSAGYTSVRGALLLLIKMAVFWVVLLLKGFFSAAVAATILSYGVFHLAQNGEFLLFPVFNNLLTWVFSTRSSGFFLFYSCLWVLIGSYESASAALDRHSTND